MNQKNVKYKENYRDLYGISQSDKYCHEGYTLQCILNSLLTIMSSTDFTTRPQLIASL